METSRTEEILKATINGTSYTAPPQSRIEALLLELKDVIEEGSGGSTIKYGGRVDTVNDLPETGEPNQFYFVGLETADNWDEYIWAVPGDDDTGHWDRLGSVSIVIDDHLDSQSANPVQNSVITLAINGLTVCLASGYDTAGVYEIGSYCTRGQTLYKSLAAQNPAGEWDSSKWQSVTVMGELTSAISALATVARTGDYNDLLNKPTIPTVADRFKSAAAAEEYDATHVYTEGEFMTLDGELYKCSSSGAYLVVKELFSYYGASLKTAEHAYLDNSALAEYGGPYLVQGQDNGYYTVILPITSGRIYDFYIPSTEYVPSTNDPACCAFSNSSSAYTSLTLGALSSNARYKSCPKTISFTAPSPGFAVTIRKTYESSYTLKEKTAYKFVKTTIAAELGEKANASDLTSKQSTYAADSTAWDTAPTENSTNPVTSNGIKLALDAKVNYDDIPTVSKAEYEAIGTEKYTNHKVYFVPDGDDLGANVQIYGWHVDPSESDPEDCVTYLEDAVGMTPAAMGATTFDYGSWKNAFFMPRPCMVKSNGKVDYYLDPNDYTKKLDGTASDIADASYDGNAMMEWPLIWWKYEAGEADGEGYFYCSNVKVDNTYNCYCNVNCDNQIVEHFYTAIYNGTGTSKLRSLSGVALTSTNGNGGTTFTQEETRAKANNTTAKTEWYIDVWADRMLINGLLILMGKSLNSQATFGRGLDSGSQTAKEAYVTGTLNDKGLFWGVTNAGTSGVKVFGMENWYSCAFHRTAGLIGAANDKYAVKMTYGTYDGTTATSYNTDGSGYNLVGTRPATGYTTKASFGAYGYLPKAVGGNTTTYYADYYYNGTAFAFVGGNANSGARDGVSCVDLSSGAGHAYWFIAASLTLKPLT